MNEREEQIRQAYKEMRDAAKIYYMNGQEGKAYLQDDQLPRVFMKCDEMMQSALSGGESREEKRIERLEFFVNSLIYVAENPESPTKDDVIQKAKAALSGKGEVGS